MKDIRVSTNVDREGQALSMVPVGISDVAVIAAVPQLGVLHPPGKKKKKTRGDHFKLRFRKNFQALLEEQVREGSAWALGIPESKGRVSAGSSASLVDISCVADWRIQDACPFMSPQNLSASEGPNYLTACAGPPSRPQRPFCAVCGFPSPYTCVSCGARYCTVRCLGTHQETR